MISSGRLSGVCQRLVGFGRAGFSNVNCHSADSPVHLNRQDDQKRRNPSKPILPMKEGITTNFQH